MKKEEVNKLVDKFCSYVPFLNQEELIKIMAFLWYVKEGDGIHQEWTVDEYIRLSEVHDGLSELFLKGENFEMHFELADDWMSMEPVQEKYYCSWIDVDERLPEDDKYILLSFSNFSVPCVGRYEEDESGGKFFIGDDDETCIQHDMYVNAWMPLPEQYKNVNDK